jgi:hypothetical protein
MMCAKPAEKIWRTRKNMHAAASQVVLYAMGNTPLVTSDAQRWKHFRAELTKEPIANGTGTKPGGNQYAAPNDIDFAVHSKKNPFPGKPKPNQKPVRKPLDVSGVWKRFWKYLLGFRRVGNPSVFENTLLYFLKVFQKTLILLPKTWLVLLETVKVF